MPLRPAILAMAAEFLGGLGRIVGLLTLIAALGVACDIIGRDRPGPLEVFGLFMN